MRFRGTFENAAVGVGHVNLEGRWFEVNHKLCEILCCEMVDLHTKRLRDITQDGNDPISDDVAEDLFSGKSASFSVDLRCIRKDGNPVWVGLTVTVQRDVQGAPQYFIVILRNISLRMAAQTHQQFLFRELAHRLKNQLAIIQGMAGQTARGAASLFDFQQTFGDRLRGLAVSTDLLIAQNWSDAPLAELVQRQVKSFVPTGDRFLYEGPEVSVTSDAAQSIGLALHELATNCVKYGAWSQSAGTLNIFWSIEDNGPEPRLSLTGIERGGPVVASPKITGFGQVVTKQIVAQKLNGTVEISYEPEGLKWTLKIPRSAYTLKERSKISVSGGRNGLHR